MIAQIQNTVTVILILISIGLGLWGGIVSNQYKNYKESINDQVQQAKNKKIRVEAIQNERYNMAQTGYASALDILNDRLRNAKTVPRDCTLPVAGNSSGSMSGASEDTGVTFTAIATRKGTCESSFYADALKTTLQCKKLIELLK